MKIALGTAKDSQRLAPCRVQLIGSHLQTGQAGLYIGNEDSPVGSCPTVELDNGTTTTVMNAAHWQLEVL